MNFRPPMGYAATAIASCAAGWLLHLPASAPATPAVRAQAPAVARIPVADRQDANPTTIVVSSDGFVTLRVEQQPLEWVLEQIAAQSGWTDVRERAGARPAGTASVSTASASAATDCEAPPRVAPAQAEQVLQAIQRGTESDRLNGLMQARNDGVPVSDAMLRTLYETDASEAVRLVAFETYLESHQGDAAATRSALEAALYLPSGAMQAEARRRLDELREMARAGEANVQAGTSE